MHRRTFSKTVTVDRSDMLDRLIALLRDRGMAPHTTATSACRCSSIPVEDADRRASKRQKDLADIARLLETHP